MPPAPVKPPNYSHQVIDRSCCVGALLYPRSGCNFLPCTRKTLNTITEGLGTSAAHDPIFAYSSVACPVRTPHHPPQILANPPAGPHEIVLTEREVLDVAHPVSLIFEIADEDIRRGTREGMPQMRGGVGRDAADIHRDRGLRRSEGLNVMREGVVELELLPSMLRLRADDTSPRNVWPLPPRRATRLRRAGVPASGETGAMSACS
jgi:hypothetical protein